MISQGGALYNVPIGIEFSQSWVSETADWNGSVFGSGSWANWFYSFSWESTYYVEEISIDAWSILRNH